MQRRCNRVSLLFRVQRESPQLQRSRRASQSQTSSSCVPSTALFLETMLLDLATRLHRRGILRHPAAAKSDSSQHRRRRQQQTQEAA